MWLCCKVGFINNSTYIFIADSKYIEIVGGFFFCSYFFFTSKYKLNAERLSHIDVSLLAAAIVDILNTMYMYTQ